MNSTLSLSQTSRNNTAVWSQSKISNENNNEDNDMVNWVDINNRSILVKKYFVKYWSNRISHCDYSSWLKNQEVIDSNNRLVLFNPSWRENYIKWVKNTYVGEGLFNIERGNNVQHCNNINNNNNSNYNNNNYNNNEISYLTIYDIHGMKYEIPKNEIYDIYNKWLNKQIIDNKVKFNTKWNKEVYLNINSIRSSYNTYRHCDNDILPYSLKNEDEISYSLVTNIINGKALLILTSQMMMLIKSNIGKEFILFSNNKVKLCVEEWKFTWKANQNKSNKYIKIQNISGLHCYIKKNVIFHYITKLLNNSRISKDIIEVHDYTGTKQYINITNILIDYIIITPIPYIQDKFLKQRENTFIHVNRTFVKAEIRSNNTRNNDWFEFIKLNDVENKELMVQKPLIRKYIFYSSVTGEALVKDLKTNDIYGKERVINLRQLNENFMISYNKYKIEFLLNDECILYEVSAHGLSYWVNKKEINKGVNRLLDYKGTEIVLNNMKVNKKKEWILVQDWKMESFVVYNQVIKEFIIEKYNSTNELLNDNVVDVVDYFYNVRRINVDYILDKFIWDFKKAVNEKATILVYSRDGV